MTLSAEDRLEINDVISLHGHLCDAGAYERLDLVFAPEKGAVPGICVDR